MWRFQIRSIHTSRILQVHKRTDRWQEACSMANICRTQNHCFVETDSRENASADHNNLNLVLGHPLSILHIRIIYSCYGHRKKLLISLCLELCCFWAQYWLNNGLTTTQVLFFYRLSTLFELFKDNQTNIFEYFFQVNTH